MCVYEIGDVQWAGVTQLRFVCFYSCNKTNILGKVIETGFNIDFFSSSSCFKRVAEIQLKFHAISAYTGCSMYISLIQPISIGTALQL